MNREASDMEPSPAANQNAIPSISSTLPAALKDSLIAGAIALVLAIPLLSTQTVQEADGLTVVGRWSYALIAAGIVFAGRLVLRLFWWDRPSAQSSAGDAAAGLAGPLAWFTKTVAPLLFLVGVFLPFLLLSYLSPSQSRPWMDLAILVMTYVMLGWGLNIVVGLAGLLDLGYVAFYAVGAYSFALISIHFGLSFWICLPLAGILAAFWGIILGFPVLRLRGDYLAIVTLAFGEIIRIVLLNWYDLTKGPDGLSGIPRPSFFGLEFKRFGDGTFADFFGIAYSPIHRIIFLYYIIFILALVTNMVTLRLRQLPLGRAWEALREDEIACRSLGINTTNTKLSAFAIGAMFGGFAGSFFATRQGFISPESFTFIESAIILAIVVLGGLGSQIGVVIASVVMIGGLEMLRDLTFLKTLFGDGFDPTLYRMLIFGVAMVAIMVWRPRGLISTRKPSIALKERKAISGDLVGEGHG